MKDQYHQIQLDNGIRVVHKFQPHSEIAHCGFILDIGSRDEEPHQAGIAHFWEHMAFKGTRKRRAFHIINRLESVGGELNAYTTKEKICFYASFLKHHYEKAIELLADITFDSIFPENQIERERNVILEEMAMYLDSPDDALQDELDALVFADHPLGSNILGTTESVQSFTRQDFNNFIKANLDTHRLVFSSVGNIPFERVLKLLKKYIEPIPEKKTKKRLQVFDTYQSRHLEKSYPASQAHCGIATTAYSLHHPQRLIFFLINNLLGGPSLNSRLNLALRERLGYVYSIESNYHSFQDTGLFAIYFATEEKFLARSQQVVLKTLAQIQNQKLGVLQLHQAKEQLLGQLAMAEESNLNTMLMMGKSILDMNKIESLEDIFQAIRAIRAEEIQAVAQEILSPDRLSTLIFRPEE